MDKYLKNKGLRFIRYANDFSVYTKSKATARKVGNAIYLFLRDKLDLPINRAKSGIRRPSTFEVLGYSFVPIYKKGTKGHYQLVAVKHSWQGLKGKLKYVTKKTLPMSFAERLEGAQRIYRGWLNNYRLGNLQAKLKSLDEWLRNRL